MTPMDVRKTFRWVHIICALALGIYLYSPWGANALFSRAILYGATPLLGLTGLLMWRFGSVLNLLKKVF